MKTSSSASRSVSSLIIKISVFTLLFLLCVVGAGYWYRDRILTEILLFGSGRFGLEIKEVTALNVTPRLITIEKFSGAVSGIGEFTLEGIEGKIGSKIIESISIGKATATIHAVPTTAEKTSGTSHVTLPKISIASALINLPQWHSKPINIRNLDVSGGDQDITVSLSLMTELFGGAVGIKSFRYSNGTIAPFTLALDKIGITDILELYAREHVEGTGTFSGQLNIANSSPYPIIKDGTLTSDGLGMLKLLPDALSLPINAGTDLVQKALSDFRYTELLADVSSDKSGTVIFKVQLNGTSPNISPDQPLVLNLSIEDNIPKLIQSLNIIKSFSSN